VPDGHPCKKCGKSAAVHRINHLFTEDPERFEHCLKCKCHKSLHRKDRKRTHVSVKHIPVGNPCEKCGKIAARHRVGHKPNGDPCCKCGLFAHSHLKKRNRKHRTDRSRVTYIGIDGEGQGRKDHRYIMLCARREVDIAGGGENSWTVEAEPGGRLTTAQCLELILRLPTRRAKVFAYSFNYDLTKMLTDLPDETLYLLFRPELRQRTGDEAMMGPRPVKWGAYKLNLQGTKFTVTKGFKRVVIWDLFKFFQAKFVSALKDWKVGSKELHERMGAMKDKRGENEWDKYDPETLRQIREYCLEECQCIGELAHKLIDSHETAGLRLKTFYGAGSSGAAMLTVMKIKECLEPCPPFMKEAVASAFFGGRFENSVIGAIREPLYNYDISSAYPYHTTFLPCLQHGVWSHTNDRHEIDSAQAALVSYGLGKNPGISTWGPFPFRTEDGTISFPIESGGGWVWKDEYIAGEKLFSHVEFKEAWIYESECDCQPFAKLPEYYLVRLRIGKEGPGIVIKLAVNSCYGKLAQSVGNARFNSWICAGIITSGCRAQILDMLGLHDNWANLLMVATDGIYTREKLNCPIPVNTGTDVEIDGKRKPLGGWEETFHPNGMFVARPGIYFPMHPTKEEIKKIRARGVGRGVVLEHWEKIVDAWTKDGVDAIARVPDVTRFCGAKTSVMRATKGYRRAEPGRVKDDGGTLPAYGQWIRRKVEMSFNPLPKRDTVNADGLTLKLREFSSFLRSVPYDKAMRSQEAKDLKAEFEILSEQPDHDYHEADWGSE
jgi:hypothetical protein